MWVVEGLFVEDGFDGDLKKKVNNPSSSVYKSELAVTDKVGNHLFSSYTQLIGILRWGIELGQIDITLETALMVQYQENPRAGHLEVLYHMFTHLKSHPDMVQLTYNPKKPMVNKPIFNGNADWTDVEEELPPRIPAPRGHRVSIHPFVDANHAGNVVTRRLHIGIIIFVQNAPIIWFSKHQNTMESATFGSEFVALQICKDLIVALRYKMCMLDVPVEGPANMFCDN
eukprot:3562201-Ditylum_brightwellii.AAC.1